MCEFTIKISQRDPVCYKETMSQINEILSDLKHHHKIMEEVVLFLGADP